MVSPLTLVCWLLSRCAACFASSTLGIYFLPHACSAFSITTCVSDHWCVPIIAVMLVKSSFVFFFFALGLIGQHAYKNHLLCKFLETERPRRLPEIFLMWLCAPGLRYAQKGPQSPQSNRHVKLMSVHWPAIDKKVLLKLPALWPRNGDFGQTSEEITKTGRDKSIAKQ